MTELETAWLAGLLEGEGSFGINHGGIKVQLTMTDRDVVSRAAGFFGSKFYCYPRPGETCKPRYYTQVGGERAANLIAAILPYMGIRRAARIRELLDHRSKAPGRGGNHRKRTHCYHGHPLDGTFMCHGKVRRRCLTCHAAREADRKQRRRQ